MKNLKISGLLVVIFMFLGTLTSCAQDGVKFSKLDPSPADISLLRLEKGAPVAVKVVYGRPQKKGRAIFGALVPYNKIWRTGANEATEVTFYKDATFGGKKVPAGTYVLHTIPGEKEWTVILNKNLNVWGAYQYKQEADLVRFKVKPSKADEALEAFSIAFDNGENKAMVLGWDKTRVVIPLKF
jgi:DUF2911 family protein